jgi:hypothetical protein
MRARRSSDFAPDERVAGSEHRRALRNAPGACYELARCGGDLA